MLKRIRQDGKQKGKIMTIQEEDEADDNNGNRK
jgi:hypothetical protein